MYIIDYEPIITLGFLKLCKKSDAFRKIESKVGNDMSLGSAIRFI